MVDEPTAPTLPADAAAASSSVRPDEPPRRLGRYAVLELIGRGGMGDVYLGLDEQLARHVAIKLIVGRTDRPGETDRLQREAVALARLAHPNVVTIHEVGEAAGQVYLVMERVQGVTLRTWLASAPRTVDEILAVMQQAGKGLAAAHTAGLIHRDFKPKTRSLLGRPPSRHPAEFSRIGAFRDRDRGAWCRLMPQVWQPVGNAFAQRAAMSPTPG